MIFYYPVSSVIPKLYLIFFVHVIHLILWNKYYHIILSLANALRLNSMQYREWNSWSEDSKQACSLLLDVTPQLWFLRPSLPAALRAAQTCRYLVYSEADFEVFRPAGATRCTDGGEIWHGGGDRRPLLHAKFHPSSVQRQGCRTPKLKFLLRFDRNVEYKRPAGAYPLRDFHKISTVCTAF